MNQPKTKERQTTSKPHSFIKVAIIDADEIFLATVKGKLEASQQFKCVGAFRDPAVALPAILKAPPDAVLLDVKLPGFSNSEWLREFKPVCRATAFVVLAEFPEEQWVFDSLAAGAAGFVTKAFLLAELDHMMHTASAGGMPLCPFAARVLTSHFQRMRKNDQAGLSLSTRELQVMQCLVAGKSRKEIAATLGIGVETAHTHVQRLYTKLSVHGRGEVVQKYGEL